MRRSSCLPARAVALAAVLAGTASAGDLEKLFDPRALRLEALTPRAYAALTGDDRLRARGVDPARHVVAPRVEDARVQPLNVRGRLHPGFAYARRLEHKRVAAGRVLDRLGPSRGVDLLRRFGAWSPEAFAHAFAALASDDEPRARRQRLQALLHAERQFEAWFVDELARRIDALEPRGRVEALDALVATLGDADDLVRVRCARVLGGVGDALAASALERAVDVETDPRVQAALVHARARHGGERLPALLRAWASSGDVALERAVVRTCGRLARGGDAPWARALLGSVLEGARGPLRDDVLAAWPAGDVGRPEHDGAVSFFGIRTHARRVLFCVDVSGSMAWPLDGMDGEGRSRLDQTRRQLIRTITRLPEGTAFGLVRFAGRVTSWRRGLVPADAGTREEAIAFVDALAIEAGTNVYGALDHAFRSDAETVFLLTDGEPNAGAVLDTALIVEEFAHRNAGGAVRLHTVGLSVDQNAELLANLAARNGGRYVPVR